MPVKAKVKDKDKATRANTKKQSLHANLVRSIIVEARSIAMLFIAAPFIACQFTA